MNDNSDLEKERLEQQKMRGQKYPPAPRSEGKDSAIPLRRPKKDLGSLHEMCILYDQIQTDAWEVLETNLDLTTAQRTWIAQIQMAMHDAHMATLHAIHDDPAVSLQRD